MRVAVLSGSNGAHACVVEMSLKGHDVVWWRRDEASFPDAIRYEGILGSGELVPERTTSDLTEAVGGADMVLAPLPAPAQSSVMDGLAGALAAGQVVAWMPGTFGSWLAARRRPDVVHLETGTLPYLTRVVAPGEIMIPVQATNLPVGSIPGEGPEADRAHAAFSRVYPAAVRLENGLDAALTNWGTVLHPPVVLHNLGAIESLGENFDIHSEGTSAGVRRCILALDAERVRLREALGLPGPHWPLSWHYEGSARSMYGPDARQRMRSSGIFRETLDLGHRYVTEDIGCGLVLFVSLGRALGQAMPVGEALLTLAAQALPEDPWAGGRTLAALGIDDLETLGPQLEHGPAPVA